MQFDPAFSVQQNRVVLMDEGKILEVAPPNDFFTNPQTERGKYFLASILTH